ncbi:unnamed protein product [Arabidopsis halleri]
MITKVRMFFLIVLVKVRSKYPRSASFYMQIIQFTL